MAIESAGPVSVPIHPSPAERPSFQGGLGVSGPAGSHRMGLSLGYPSGVAGPSESSVRGDEQLLTLTSSVAAVTDTPPVLAAAPEQRLAPRQPPPAVTAAAKSPTH